MKVFIQAFRHLVHLIAAVGPTCRYQPTCSQYATQAIERFGLFSGGFLAIKRVCRCHPFAGFGEDPVPSMRSN